MHAHMHARTCTHTRTHTSTQNRHRWKSRYLVAYLLVSKNATSWSIMALYSCKQHEQERHVLVLYMYIAPFSIAYSSIWWNQRTILEISPAKNKSLKETFPFTNPSFPHLLNYTTVKWQSKFSTHSPCHGTYLNTNSGHQALAGNGEQIATYHSCHWSHHEYDCQVCDLLIDSRCTVRTCPQRNKNKNKNKKKEEK